MSETKPKVTPGYLETILIALVVAGGVAFGYHQFFPPPQIKTFDLKGYLRAQTALIQAGELSEAQFKEKLDRMEAFLDGEKAIILLKDVVMRNGDEIPAQ